MSRPSSRNKVVSGFAGAGAGEWGARGLVDLNSNI